MHVVVIALQMSKKRGGWDYQVAEGGAMDPDQQLHIVSAHRRILGLASVVCVLVKIRVSGISLYKLDTDKLTAPFESAHQFTLVCTVSDSKTVPGCHYNLCSNHSFVLTD